MSFGISEAIGLFELVVKAWTACAKAPGKVHDAEADFKSTIASLKYLEKMTKKQGSFIMSDPELALVLKQNMKDLKSDLKHLHKIITKWGKLCEPEGTMASAKKLILKGLFVAKDDRELDDFSAKLKNHNTRIQMTVQILHFGASEETRAAMKEQRKQDAVESRNRAKETKKLVKTIDKLTKLVASQQRQGIESIPEAVNKPAKLLKQLEGELVKQGVSQMEVNSSMDSIKQNLEKLNLSTKKSPAANTKQVRILVVDGSNVVRSVTMQAYLELVRVWTVNTTRRWIFQEVASAGYSVKSSFTTKHQSQIKHVLKSPGVLTDNKALISLAEQNHFRSAEKRAIFARLDTGKTQGLKAIHFNNWDYILCFDKQAFSLLQNLRVSAQGSTAGKPQSSRVILIEGTELHKDIQTTIRGVKKAARQWLAEELQWTKPDAPIKGGIWRTLQVVVPETCYKALLAKKGAKRKEIQAKSGCRIDTSANSSGTGSLVTIAGPKDALPQVKKLVERSK
ncbi:hypothetical protein MMC17_004564 [Xylographa soralifera]|nr:hypothetical protein [Xylographa soralifera]